MSYTWNDYPYGPFVTMRVFQIVLGFVVTALSGYLTGNRDYNRFIIPLFPHIHSVVWGIITVSVYASHNLGQALLVTIYDFLIGLAVVATEIYAAVYGVRGGIHIAGLVLNLIVGVLYFMTFALGVKTHQTQVRHIVKNRDPVDSNGSLKDEATRA